MEIPPNPEYPPQIPFGLRCPFCGHEGVPFTKKQLSTGGWVLFAVLVLFCIPLCWLPFVIDGCQEIVRHCARCGSRLG
jgi:lipopolysaccharide-induced tumor necrosis factor-alpha factor